MTKPLDDITIVEVDSWMAAPSAGAILADLGARIIKIEPLSGDPMRKMGRPAKIEAELKTHDFQFDVDNRGKQSICLDLRQKEAIDIVMQLCQKADVFMCNLLAKRQEKYHLDPESLLAVNSKLVHATLTGYGTRGPEAWRPGYDSTAFFARSGLHDAMREGAAGNVPMPRPAQGDHVTGLALVGAILAAIRQVDRTGEGQVVETSLYEAAVWTLASDYAVTLVDQQPVRKRSREEQLSPMLNRYPCGDGQWIVFNMPEASWWHAFCQALAKPEWLEDERFASPSGRYQRMAELVPAIDEILAQQSRDEWGEIFDAHGIIWAPVLSVHEVITDPQAEAINLFPSLSAPGLGDYRTIRIPMHFHTLDILPSAPAPQRGEHTQQILTDLGYSIAEIEALLQDQTAA